MKILFNLLGIGLGDTVCSEPIIRYAMHPNFNNEIAILTKYPRVFNHISVPINIGMPSDFKEILACPFYKTPDNDKIQTHPFAYFAQPYFIHSVDFQSLFMLRRMLRDEDKHIKLDITEKDINTINKFIHFDQFIAIHVGATEHCRLYPDSFYNDLITQLIKLDYKIVIFGNSQPISANINIEHSNLINLIDKLDIGDLFALIAKAKLLITNDSSPVHIAAAFDNNIIVLSSIRHPDKLLHVRQGNRYYKAKGFYNKLLMDDKEINFNEDATDYFVNKYDIKELTPNLNDIIITIKEWEI